MKANSSGPLFSQLFIGTAKAMAPQTQPSSTNTSWRSKKYSGEPDILAPIATEAEATMIRPQPSSTATVRHRVLSRP